MVSLGGEVDTVGAHQPLAAPQGGRARTAHDMILVPYGAAGLGGQFFECLGHARRVGIGTLAVPSPKVEQAVVVGHEKQSAMRIRGFEQGDKFAVMRFELFRVEFLRRYVGVVDADAENGKIRPDKFQVFGQVAATQPGRYVGPVNPYGMIDQSVPVVFRKDACQRETSALSGVDAYVRRVAGFGVVYQETVRGSVMLREEGVSAMYGVGICRGVVGIAQYAQLCEIPGGRIARIEPERQAGGRVAGADCGSGQSEGISAVGLDAPATFPCSGKTDTVVLGSVRPQDAEREYHAPGGHYRVAQGGKVHPQPVAQVSGLYMAAPDVEDVYFAFAGG